MSSPHSPNQPSKATYRNRRILALAVLAVVIVLIWGAGAAVVNFVSGLSNNGGAKPAATTSAPATSGVIADCAPGTVTVQANVGIDGKQQSIFAAKVKPSFWFTLTNNGLKACNFNAGSKVSFMTVTSGKEVIWDNKDCKTRATSDSDYVTTLQPATPVESTPAVWDRVFSSSTGCDATTEKPVFGGGASYHLVVTVNGIKSADVQFILN